MFQEKSIGVVVPAYNEEKFIGKVIDTMPDFVDKIIIINDKSADKTGEIIEDYKKKNNKVVAIHHEKNSGNGKALATGYLEALKLDLDVIAVMDGDGQMDPKDLFNIVLPVIWGEIDYVKGNRLTHPDIVKIMPRHRYIGNSILTLLTKFATGYWHLMDPQYSFTAISKKALKVIEIEKMVSGFGYNADILNMLNIKGFKARDVDAKPIYGDEKSKIKLVSYIPRTSWILVKLFFRRLWRRYVILDFHPLILFYFFAFLNFVFIITPLTLRLFFMYFTTGEFPKTTFTILTFTTLITFQSILFAIWMDMEYNKNNK